MNYLRYKILKVASQLKVYILKNILHLCGFKIIRDHWVYTKRLSQNAVIIDLGANTGTFSKIIAQKFGAACFAVEPNAYLYDKLDIQIGKKFNYAVTAKDGYIDFYLSENPEASSLMNNFQNLWAVEKKSQVIGVTWETLLKKLDIQGQNIDVVKLDVEGAELDIIQSLTINDIKSIHQITVEFHHKLNINLHEQTVSAIKKLLDYGFTGIANTITPTEILFIHIEYLQFNSLQKILFSLYQKLKFKMY